MDALIRADRDVDLLFIPGAGHTSGGAYGTRKRNDFVVRHLPGVEPPPWNAGSAAATQVEAGPDHPDAWLGAAAFEQPPGGAWREG